MPPAAIPVKRTPKINSLIKDAEVKLEDAVAEKTDSNPAQEEEKKPEVEISATTDDDNSAAADTANINVEKENTEEKAAEMRPEADEDEPIGKGIVSAGIRINRSFEKTAKTSDEKFVTEWNNMFELLFREIPTVYYPLKGVLPDFDGNIIRVKVKNELMKENFESRIRLALEYLRSHVSPTIDNIKVELIKTEEKSKLIYDTQDKINDLQKENADLPEFLKILQLSPKDL